ncbi:MAG: NUDIX hydrolase [Burkholderiales bacterium]|nr:MAG: NUDIX hydrolase [Burkholderiales bacterium]
MSLWKPSVTVAALVERDGRFLLVEETTAQGVRINQPAGHLDPGESLLEAVVREALEETGCAVEPRALVGVYMARFVHQSSATDVTYLRFAFACELVRELPGRALDAGILRTVWLTPEEIRAAPERHRSPLVSRSVEDYLAGHRAPLALIHTHASCLYGSRQA